MESCASPCLLPLPSWATVDPWAMSGASPSDASMDEEYEEQMLKLLGLDDSSILHPKTPVLVPQERGRKPCGYAPRTTPDYGQTTIQHTPPPGVGRGWHAQPLPRLA